jgi:hypothetical protein
MVSTASVAPGHIHRQEPRRSRATTEELGRSAKYAGTENEPVARRIKEASQDGHGIFQARDATGDRAVIEWHENAAPVVTEDASQPGRLACLAC